MKTAISLILALAAVLLYSCDDKVVLIGDYEETAVVYGLLDQSDSTHMIKITRTFLGDGKPPEVAQIPDSSYFKSLVATVTERLPNGTIGRTWILSDSTVATKETDGVFYAPEQKVYVFNTRSLDNSNNPTYEPLLKGARYELKIIANPGKSNEFEVYGSTEIISSVSSNADASSYQFIFAQNSNLVGVHVPCQLAIYRSNGESIDTRLNVVFKEYLPGDTLTQSFEWNLTEKDPSEYTGDLINFTAEGQTFYELIAANCSDNPDIFKRNIESITLNAVVGSLDLYYYTRIVSVNSTLAQSKPKFTNLTTSDDRDAIGIFSSRYTHTVKHNMVDFGTTNRCLSKVSTHELCHGPITYQKLFCSQNPEDIAASETWACN